MADPHFANVVLLAVNDNQPDGTTTFVDQSTAARTLTAVGNMQYDTALAPTGLTSSGLSDGSGDALTASASADFAFTGDFCWEAYVYRANSTGNDSIINIGANDQFVWYFDTSGRANYFAGGSNSLLGTETLANTTWTHVCIERVGTTVTSYIGGVAGSAPATRAGTVGGTLALNLFRDGPTGASQWGGNMAPIRMTNVSRYNGNFTPPPPPFPTSAIDPPVADFSGTPLSGDAPLSVTFTDLSTNTPTSWLWDFGDGQTSTQQNPTNIYASAGTYTVTLTATNAAGSDPEVKTNYITVSDPTPTPPQTPNSGGYEIVPSGRRRDPEEVRQERVRLGIIPEQIVEDVALRQAENPGLDEHQRTEELLGELRLRGIEMQARYMVALNARREQLITEEIARRLKAKMANDDIAVILLMAGAA